MKSFFKIFFASLLALIIFTVMGFFLLIGIVALASSDDKSTIDAKAVLVLNLSTNFPEQSKDDPFSAFMNKTENDIPSLYDMVRMIKAAKNDITSKGALANSFSVTSEITKVIFFCNAISKSWLVIFLNSSSKAPPITEVWRYIHCFMQQ